MNKNEFNYERFRWEISDLPRLYPFVRVDVKGRSLLGRAIYSIQIGEGEEKVLFAGGFHGQEWITVLLLMRFAERLCEALKGNKTLAGFDITRAMKDRALLIVPCINPDGIEIAQNHSNLSVFQMEVAEKICHGDFSEWNANARGVDINHNFNAGWHQLREMEKQMGINGPAPRRYGGSAPESEPETKTAVRLCRSNPIRHALAFHSQGEEIYWEYGENTPKWGYILAELFSHYSGYELASPDGIASHGGFKDWFIQEFHRPAFTIEIGKGKNPLPVEMLEDIYNKLEGMMTLATIV